MNNIVKGILNQEGFINVGPQKDLIYGYVDEKGDLYLISDSPFGFDWDGENGVLSIWEEKING